MVTYLFAAPFLSPGQQTNPSMVEDPAAKYVSARPLKRVDDSSLDLARRWVEDCLNFHIDCPGPEVVALPTRVLDVGPEDGSHDPRLFLTRGIKGRYAALSYCWGGPQQFKLSLDTLQEKQQDISMCELPEGFQDAVEVTRGLRLRYLWIDALCIIQDSDADKAIQMATMDQVYHSAWVTICAANVRKCTRSFLSFHVPRSYHHPYELAKISFPCPNGSKGNIFIEAGNEYLANKEPLNNRGWALQERLVSPRVLTFGHHQMYWQCQSALHGEGGVTEEFWRPYLPRLGNDFFWQKKETKSPTDPHQIYGNWFDIVEDYTLRQLTVSSDKLPALSGIATRFASVLNDSYCAGLWKNDLKNGLGWQRDSYGGRRSAEYRAPTWSWASVEDDVSWSGRRRQSQLDIVMRTSVLSCSIRLDHPAAPFGAVREGTIELRGLVKDVDWDGGEELYDEDGEWIGDVTPDTREEILDRGPDGEETEPYIFYMGRERDKANSVTRRVSCIPVTDYHSLVLARQQDGQYTRLGIIYCERDPEKWGYLKEQVEELYGNATERTITIR